MTNAIHPSRYWGSSVVPIVFLEITPLVLADKAPLPISIVSCKHYLQEQTLRAWLSSVSNPEQRNIKIEWIANASVNTIDLSQGHLLETRRTPIRASFHRSSPSSSSFPVFYLPSDNPADVDLQPCRITAYAHRSLNHKLETTKDALVENSCLIRILPPALAVTMGTFPSSSGPEWFRRELFLQGLSGEVGNDTLPEEMENEVIRNHNPDTIQQLTLHISRRLSKPVRIGTTSDAFEVEKKQTRRSLKLKRSIQSHCAANNIQFRTPNDDVETNAPETSKTTLDHNESQLLLIHSPNHADGKTMLAQAIAKRSGCTRIHLIRPGYMLAKYGINADAALESMLHSILVSAAANQDSVCVILDQIDAMLPPRLSGRSSGGDAVEPILTAIASYLRTLSLSLQQRNEFPFPMKNKLYSINGRCGRVLSLKLCLVGIMTCPDDGWQASVSELEAGHGIFDILVATRYRTPPTTAKTRLDAFSGASASHQVYLDASAQARLPGLAQGFHAARGSTFGRVASILRRADKNPDGTVSARSLERAMEQVKNETPDSAKSSFEVSAEMVSSRTGGESDLFGTVGGAVSAKRALEDALALSHQKRTMLARFGMSPPTGVLLYGPPGCGKTLLAKAVAKLLKRPSEAGSSGVGSLGGSFLSISSSDIVSSEIGTSEKTLLSAFEFADKNPPAVIFFDEFQALFTERSRGGSGKLASTLLQCMDDVRRWGDSEAPPADVNSQQRSGEQPPPEPRVVVLGATNTPWMVDRAFLRAGRFDRVVHVDLPTEAERKSILLVHLQKMRIENRESSSMMADLAAGISSRTVGFSGADLAALCRAAAIRALLDETTDHVVTEAHFVGALEQDVKPSSDESLMKRLREWKP